MHHPCLPPDHHACDTGKGHCRPECDKHSGGSGGGGGKQIFNKHSHRNNNFVVKYCICAHDMLKLLPLCITLSIIIN